MSQAKEAAKEIAVVSQRLNFKKCVDDYEAIISKHYSPLVIAADQLAQAAEKISKEEPWLACADLTELDTALANYKTVREG